MIKQKNWLLLILVISMISIITSLSITLRNKNSSNLNNSSNTFIKKFNRPHLNHSNLFKKAFKSPQDVTTRCLKCHPNAAHNIMKTTHWKWEGDPVIIPNHSSPIKIGKKNLINNFCISITSNWSSCTRCHSGYGWKDNTFDFNNQKNVDCLICHDWSGTYRKGKSGLPQKDVDLLIVAKSVGYPKRENCGICHYNGGGGMGVKHGDLDESLINPNKHIDIHMGAHNMLCIDCHKTKSHNITGRSFSVSVDHSNSISCTDCHKKMKHNDIRLDGHIKSVACETCHIPQYAKKIPTKMSWDWSKAGNNSRSNESDHRYLKTKGEFIYEKNITPKYYWFNMSVNRYLLGDIFDPKKNVDINLPHGSILDKKAKIHPFKVHSAIQPYDKIYKYLLPPTTSGVGGYWHNFNWDKALRLGAKASDLKYSGKYGFIKTNMYWPLSHMVSPKENALKCIDCHNQSSRMNWKALGYEGDPSLIGGRK